MEHKSIIFFLLISVCLLGILHRITYNQASNKKSLQITDQPCKITQKNKQQGKFIQWKRDFSMSFNFQEEIYRRQIFIQNLRLINQHNSNFDKTYQLGLNQFSHLSSKQFAGLFLGLSENLQAQVRSQKNSNDLPKIVQNVDWEALGKVSVVKNQGSCDAGYAFCTSSLVQSFYMFQNKNVLLSEQQIVDCSADYTTFGCNSGSRIGTINFAKQKGLTLQSSYSYTGVKGSCKKATGEYLANFTLVQSNGCEQITKNLYTSPMTVAVNAQTWQSYKAGIYDGCTSNQVNHDTYLIGVTSDFWRIKNSFGNRWGEYGYIRLKIGNTCGICQKTGFGFK